MPTFRLLHASDFHIGEVPNQRGSLFSIPGSPLRLRVMGSHDDKVQHAFARFVEAYDRLHGFDALLITGDLATTGEVIDLQRAEEFISSAAVGTAASPRPVLNTSNRPTLVWVKSKIRMLPGNHDRYQPLLPVTTPPYPFGPGSSQFENVVVSASWGMHYQGVRELLRLPSGRRVLIVLGADLSLEQGDFGQRAHTVLPGWLGQGRVYGAPGTPLERLRDLTETYQKWFSRQGEPRPVIIWAIHFDPFSPCEALELIDSRLLRDAAIELNVPIILCGHTHETKIKPLGPSTVVLACGTTCQFASPQGHDCQVVEITVDDDRDARIDVQVTWYRHDSYLNDFAPLMAQTLVLQ